MKVQKAIPKKLAKDFIRRAVFVLPASLDDLRRAAVEVRQRSRGMPFPTTLPLLISSGTFGTDVLQKHVDLRFR